MGEIAWRDAHAFWDINLATTKHADILQAGTLRLALEDGRYATTYRYRLMRAIASLGFDMSFAADGPENGICLGMIPTRIQYGYIECIFSVAWNPVYVRVDGRPYHPQSVIKISHGIWLAFAETGVSGTLSFHYHFDSREFHCVSLRHRYPIPAIESLWADKPSDIPVDEESYARTMALFSYKCECVARDRREKAEAEKAHFLSYGAPARGHDVCDRPAAPGPD